LSRPCSHPHLPSFPTRRSSDLSRLFIGTLAGVIVVLPSVISVFRLLPAALPLLWRLFRKSVRLLCLCPKLSRPNRLGTARRAILDRKSTRLNSSHVSISYAVFC